MEERDYLPIVWKRKEHFFFMGVNLYIGAYSTLSIVLYNKHLVYVEI